LGHPNIVESTDMGFTNHHVPYIVFEYLEGALLTDEVYRVGGLPVRRAVWIAQQIASALHAAHNAGIVHRDLKSDNVFLTDKDDALDHVKVLDFGISRFLEAEDEQTRRGMVMGTPEFMAPEQITAPDSVDKRADIYALGVILYEMLTARRPFSNDEDPRALMHRIVNNAPPPLQRPEVPHAMAQMILEKMLAKDPAQRYQSMIDVEAALDSFVTQDGGKTSRRSRPLAAQADAADRARNSDLIPRSAQMLDTPWPPQSPTLDKPLQNVMLPPPPSSRKPWMMYGIAAAGLLVGGIGIAMAMRGGNESAPKTVTSELPPAPVNPLPAASTTPAPKESAAKVAIELNANVPNARVTFRRRVAAAPTTMQITPSDIVELVEISAPGYKTVRYWLTFDRPTTLNAKLVKGTGLDEASEEATLVALGEVAAPSRPAITTSAQPAVAIAKPEPKAEPVKAEPKLEVKTVAKAAPEIKAEPKPVVVAAVTPAPVKPTTAATAVPTPRKIGRGAEETKAEPAVAATMQVLPPTPAKTEPLPQPDAEPAVTKTDVEPKAEPAVEPAVAKPSIDKATVTSVIGAHRPEVLKCFAEGKKKNPNMKGTVTLQLQVDTTGKVRAQVQSTLNNPLVASCVIKSANGWRFPARAGGDSQLVVYPFTIN
nr:protein kinase [Deltaproteobacteria bacterium]